MTGPIANAAMGLGGLILAFAAPLSSTAAPLQLGECREDHVQSIIEPLSADHKVVLDDGITLHYYQEKFQTFPLKIGQRVRICLVDIGKFCGFREVSTRTYLMHNPLTHGRQFLPDQGATCTRAR